MENRAIMILKDNINQLYKDKALEIASLVIEKQDTYGDSFGKSGEIIKILYPNGIKLEEYNDFLAIVRIIDKLFRIANSKDAFGESPWMDVMGYSLLSTVREIINKKRD